ncbi:MAG: VanZ family protein [Lachnospiraceae bacterium]|nr:VanZ family protein [Lachnospiraceae bacterium]
MYSLSVSIHTAMILFPIMAAFITIPYVLIHYHRFGSVVLFRAIIFYSFILYLLCTYLLVVLPLPSFAEVAKLTRPSTQLVPFQFVNDIEMYTKFSVWTPGTYWDSFFSGAFLQVLYNILMFIPFGIYLRYYYRRNIFECVLLSFSLSLFFELTQLTGLYGIYPRAYRLFDVDDLMLNTMGGIIGFIMEPCFVFLFPSKERLNEISYERGKRVSVIRRLFAACIDWSILMVTAALMHTVYEPVSVFNVLLLNNIQSDVFYAAMVVIYFILGSYFMGGATIGKRVVRIKVVDKKGKKAGILQYFVRYTILYGLFAPGAFYLLRLFQYINTDSVTRMDFAIGAFLMIVLAVFMILFWGCMVIRIFIHGNLFLYEFASNTCEESVIPQPKKNKAMD